MSVTAQPHVRYEEVTAANMGIDIPEHGLTVAHVIAHARKTGTRCVSWLPMEVAPN